MISLLYVFDVQSCSAKARPEPGGRGRQIWVTHFAAIFGRKKPSAIASGNFYLKFIDFFSISIKFLCNFFKILHFPIFSDFQIFDFFRKSVYLGEISIVQQF